MAERKLEEEFDQVREDLKTLQNDVSELASLLREIGTERVSGSLRAQRERLRKRASAIADQGRQYTEEFEQLVGGHPESSLAIAFGFGFLVAKLLDGGRR